MDLLKITRAEYIEGYSLKLWFNNGEVRVAALSGAFVGPVFEPLRDVRCFMNFKIPYNTIEWGNIGEMAEWSNAAVLKTFQLASGFGHINGHICGCPLALVTQETMSADVRRA